MNSHDKVVGNAKSRPTREGAPGDKSTTKGGIPMTETRTYTCDQCKGTFEAVWSEEEAKQEMKDNGWGHMPMECMAQVCDKCYDEIMNPHEASNAPRHH